MTLQLGVLCSGSGTNLAAILEAIAQGSLDARIAVVIANKSDAMAIKRAEQANVPVRVLLHGEYPDRVSYDAALVQALQQAGAGFVVLAGFMRLVTSTLLGAFADRVINIHPALLPAFPGVDAQAQAIAYGVPVSGCTVHLVDTGMDTGPIVAQAVVPVHEGDTREALAARILGWEHRLLVEVLRWFSEGRVRVVRETSSERALVHVLGKSRVLGLNPQILESPCPA